MYFLLIIASAAGLAILGIRIMAIGAAVGVRAKLGAAWRCVLDWGISISLALIGGLLGGLTVGGPSGLVAGTVISTFWIGWGGEKNQ